MAYLHSMFPSPPPPPQPWFLGDPPPPLFIFYVAKREDILGSKRLDIGDSIIFLYHTYQTYDVLIDTFDLWYMIYLYIWWLTLFSCWKLSLICLDHLGFKFLNIDCWSMIGLRGRFFFSWITKVCHHKEKMILLAQGFS